MLSAKSDASLLTSFEVIVKKHLAYFLWTWYMPCLRRAVGVAEVPIGCLVLSLLLLDTIVVEYF